MNQSPTVGLVGIEGGGHQQRPSPQELLLQGGRGLVPGELLPHGPGNRAAWGGGIIII